jgi:hypothetical protein
LVFSLIFQRRRKKMAEICMSLGIGATEFGQDFADICQSKRIVSSTVGSWRPEAKFAISGSLAEKFGSKELWITVVFTGTEKGIIAESAKRSEMIVNGGAVKCRARKKGSDICLVPEIGTSEWQRIISFLKEQAGIR